ncbi:hypothetical protein BC938DRAFT_470670 [Jimgerdemannia flammicorona]|uniref:Uncharacterized protein n=1 Tax=Jimgerdemannia flammicorona TaxID=994334 RepID=A0A433R048_9FUNG|nr:hypothetical protein BC938DRAFT_470670 [Jimgerdemannia flammicorona]
MPKKKAPHRPAAPAQKPYIRNQVKAEGKIQTPATTMRPQTSSKYFRETPASEYSHIGFYEFRQHQKDFTFCFRKEATKFLLELKRFSRSEFDEVRNSCQLLLKNFKNHRQAFQSVTTFWEDIEKTTLKSVIFVSIYLQDVWIVCFGGGDQFNNILFFFFQHSVKGGNDDNDDAGANDGNDDDNSSGNDNGADNDVRDVDDNDSGDDNDDGGADDDVGDNEDNDSSDSNNDTESEELALRRFIKDSTPEESEDEGKELREDKNYINPVADKTAPPMLTSYHRKEIKMAFNRMPKAQMWRLESGTIVEEELYKIGKGLNYEHFGYIISSGTHSFILDTEDDNVRNHFNDKDFEEITTAPQPSVPQLSEDVAEYLSRFSTKMKVADVRETLNSQDERFGRGYTRDAYHDLDYIRYALHTVIREIEGGHLKHNNLESWYNCHIWHVIVDQGFGNLSGISVVRGENITMSTALRKNGHRKSNDRRNVGHRGDWVLRSVGNGDRDEFGVGEAAKEWTDNFGTKFMEAGLKVPKALKDMLTKLMRKADWKPELCSRMQTVGIIHSGLIMMPIFMDCPGGFVCRIQRGEIMEVPNCEESITALLPILAAILNIKRAVQETAKALSTRVPTIATSFQEMIVKRRKEERAMPDCMTTPTKPKQKRPRQ